MTNLTRSSNLHMVVIENFEYHRTSCSKKPTTEGGKRHNRIQHD